MSLRQYRLTQDTAAVKLVPNGRNSITQLVVGTVVALNGKTSRALAPEMVEIESEGRNYALFASDFADRSEPLYDE